MDSTDSEKRASFTANKWMYEHLKQAPISEVSGMPVPDFMLEFGFCIVLKLVFYKNNLKTAANPNICMIQHTKLSKK